MKRLLTVLAIIISTVALTGCKSGYQDYIDDFEGFEPTYGTKVNNETIADLATIYQDSTVEDLNIIPIENLREDFIFGVDISSILDVEENR